ncbi:hypothetical protein Scep_027765 [Stephania cephalantha]|uniref:Uncharacterized protein n=1 Tax=Stephania cephalantha TaxID=152367 RepID=A0AAP0EBU0_9MAGN
MSFTHSKDSRRAMTLASDGVQFPRVDIVKPLMKETMWSHSTAHIPILLSVAKTTVLTLHFNQSSLGASQSIEA